MFDNLDDPKRQALLMMAAGLLSPVRSRGASGFGEALGRGIQGGLLGFNEASQNRRRNELTDLQKRMSQFQLDAAQRDADFSKRNDALAAQFFQAPQTQDDYSSMNFGQQTPGKADLAGYAAALPSLGGKGVEKAIGIQQALTKDSPWSKIDPKDYTPESIRVFAATRDFASLVPKVKKEAVDQGDRKTFVDPFNPPQSLPMNLSVADQQRIPLEKQRIGMDRTRLGMEAGRFNYEIGDGRGLPQKSIDAIALDVGKKEAENRLAATSSLPQVEAEAAQTIGLVDKLINHPGFSTVVGAKGITGAPAAAGYPIPGTDAADFVVLRDQIVGKQFLQAYETLKGSGQITEVEGKKATDAMARMNTAQSEAAFKEAANEFKSVIQGVVQRARTKAGASNGWSIQRVQ